MTRTGYKLIVLSLLSGLFVGFLDNVVDYLFFYDKPFAELLVEDVPRFEVYFRTVVLLIFVAFGIVTARVVSNRERTAEELHRSREQLRESDAKYSALAENSPVGIFIHQDGKMVYANPALAAIFGYARVQLEGLETWMLVYPDDREELKKGVVRRLAGESEPPEREIRGITKTGETNWLNVSVTRIEYRGRSAIMGNIVDITQRRLAERALRDSQEEIRRLSSRMLEGQERERGLMAQELHEGIGQSLSAVKFFVESAIPRAEGDAASVKLLESIVPRIQQTIDEVRRLAMALRPSSLDELGLLPTVGWFCREFRSAHPEIRFESHVDVQEEETPGPLKIVVYRILQEALNNVAIHSGAARVCVSLGRTEDTLELVVEDDGSGFNVAGHAAAEGASSGFGLDTMRERAELSGGELSVASTRGSGTTVRVRWPLT